MLRKFVPALLAATIIGLPLWASVTLPAFAQSANAEAIRVRGGIVSFSGETLKVGTREGEVVDIALLKGWMVSSVARAAVPTSNLAILLASRRSLRKAAVTARLPL